MASNQTPTVQNIVVAWLREHEYDGLYCAIPHSSCACQLENIMPCSCYMVVCRPGYYQPCPPECGEHDWHIGPEKPAGEAAARPHKCRDAGTAVETAVHANGLDTLRTALARTRDDPVEASAAYQALVRGLETFARHIIDQWKANYVAEAQAALVGQEAAHGE